MLSDKLLKAFEQNGIHFEDLEQIDLELLASKKKLQIFLTCNTLTCKVLFVYPNKSRILMKNVDEFDELVQKIQNLKNVKIENKFLFFHSPICSKAKKYAQETYWKVLHVSL